MISIQKMIDALAGRRIAVGADQDNARRELKACAAQLALAQSENAALRREVELLRSDLTDAVKVADGHRSEVASLRAANRRLVELAESRQSVDGRAPAAPTPSQQLRRQAEQDRRNTIALQDRIDDLLRENEQLLKALAG